jgi:hypothetical protein
MLHRAKVSAHRQCTRGTLGFFRVLPRDTRQESWLSRLTDSKEYKRQSQGACTTMTESGVSTFCTLHTNPGQCEMHRTGFSEEAILTWRGGKMGTRNLLLQETHRLQHLSQSQLVTSNNWVTVIRSLGSGKLW